MKSAGKSKGVRSPAGVVPDRTSIPDSTQTDARSPEGPQTDAVDGLTDPDAAAKKPPTDRGTHA